MPLFEAEVNALIAREEKEISEIEKHLNPLIKLTDMGMADDIFIRLLEYYKTVDAEAAAIYWKKYDKNSEED